MSSIDDLRTAGWDESVVGFAAGLDADGYDLRLERLPTGDIAGEVVARPDACADCLVPKSVLATIIANTCGLGSDRVHLRYPTDERAGA